MTQGGWLWVSLALWLAAMGMVAARPQRAWPARLWALALGLFGLLTLMYVVADHFTAAGIDSSVIFHLQVGFDGAGFGDYLRLMAACVAAVLLGLWGCVGVYRRLVRGAPRGARKLGWAPVPLALAAWSAHPGVSDLAGLYGQQWQASKEEAPPKDYQLPVDLKLDRPKNLVLLYLESLEQSFLDERRFPGLTPNLRRLQAASVHFTDVRQLNGTGWTIAGMVASQCGVPLLTLLQGNDMTGTDRFMSEATCLGDLLKGQGYQMTYMGGARLEFAGKGRFYASHGYANVEGLGALRERITVPERVTAWGLYDEDLFTLAERRFEALSEAGEPFGLTMLTLDTHPPEGHVSPACAGLLYRDGRDPMLNAVHCTDRLVGAFVDRLMAGPYFKNTVVWIASDHLAMRNTAWNRLESGPRRNLLMMLADGQTPQAVTKPGATLDTGATVLHSLGADQPVLGYGRSLLGDAPTLVETAGPQTDTVLAQGLGFLASLWSHPQLQGGVRWVDERRVRLGARTVRYPVFLLLDDALGVKAVSFGTEDLPERVGTLAPAQRFVWLDRCDRIQGLVTTQGQRPPINPEHPDCLAVGAMGSSDWSVFPLTADKTIRFAQVRDAAAGLKDDAPGLQARRARAEQWARYGSYDVQRLHGGPAGKGEVWIRSGGGLAHTSSVRRAGDEVALLLNRGITVLGFDQQGAPHKLAYRDTCGEDMGQPLIDGVPRLEDLHQWTQATPSLHTAKATGGLAVVVHDSAVCGGASLASLAGSDVFPRLKGLRLREPYVGYLDERGHLHEYTGPADDEVALHLENFVGGLP